jgi:hypothetical protein
MQAIAKGCFNKKWIVAQSLKLAPVDPVQLERSIHAFEILGRLADADVAFVFKGGTAVLLRLGTMGRLSVDVDIVTRMPTVRLEKTLADIGRRAPFHGWREKIRRKGGLPKRRHYYFAYKSVMLGTEDRVILDVLEEADLHSYISPLAVRMPFFSPDHRILVQVPSVECLLGDKLTAFAPHTVGIGYDADTTMQIVKQLFDIGRLFDAAGKLQDVADTYVAIFNAENSYRKNRFSMEQALLDTYQASLTLNGMGLTKGVDSETATLLQHGIDKVQSHLVQCRFTLQEAKVAAAKAALLSRLILHNHQELKLRDLRFDPANTECLKTAMIQRPLEYLNKLKGANNEAFHYWHKIQTLFGA